MANDIDGVLDYLQGVRPTQDIEGFNQILGAVSRLMYPAESRLRLAYLPLDKIREQDLNAQVMPKGMFDQLTANIKRHGGVLQSVPMVATIAGDDSATVWWVSGHHRSRALKAAKKEKDPNPHVLVLMYEGVSWDDARAAQLAHNNISGTPDPQIMGQIWNLITDVQARFEAYVDPLVFEAIPAPVSFQQVDIDWEKMARTVVLAFLPTQYDDFEAAMQELSKDAKDADTVILAEGADYKAWIAALNQVREGLEIIHLPTAVAAMARLALERLAQLEDKADGDTV